MKFHILALLILVNTNFYGLSNGSDDDVNLCHQFPYSGKLWPSYDDPRAFFKCSGWFRYQFECGDNLLFSFPCQVCVWPNDWVAPPPVNEISPDLPECVIGINTSPPILIPTITTTEESIEIETETIPTETTTQPEATTTNCYVDITVSPPPSTSVNLCQKFPDSEILWPHYEDSSSFIQCLGDIQFSMNCPADLLFSFGCQVCVWPLDWVPPPPANEISPDYLPPCIIHKTIEQLDRLKKSGINLQTMQSTLKQNGMLRIKKFESLTQGA